MIRPVGPTPPRSPVSVANAVDDVEGNSQINAMKPTFGDADVYGHAYTYVAGTDRHARQPAAVSGVERDPG